MVESLTKQMSTASVGESSGSPNGNVSLQKAKSYVESMGQILVKDYAGV